MKPPDLSLLPDNRRDDNLDADRFTRVLDEHVTRDELELRDAMERMLGEATPADVAIARDHAMAWLEHRSAACASFRLKDGAFHDPFTLPGW